MKVLEEREDWQGMLTELMVTMMLHFEHSRIQVCSMEGRVLACLSNEFLWNDARV